jgi:putative endonuclease
MKDKSEKLINIETQAPQAYYVYLVCCANGTLYVGYTKNVEQRIALHNAGLGGRYTRNNRPVELICSCKFNSKIEAQQAERNLKKKSPSQKLAFCQAISLHNGDFL